MAKERAIVSVAPNHTVLILAAKGCLIENDIELNGYIGDDFGFGMNDPGPGIWVFEVDAKTKNQDEEDVIYLYEDEVSWREPTEDEWDLIKARELETILLLWTDIESREECQAKAPEESDSTLSLSL